MPALLMNWRIWVVVGIVAAFGAMVGYYKVQVAVRDGQIASLSNKLADAQLRQRVAEANVAVLEQSIKDQNAAIDKLRSAAKLFQARADARVAQATADAVQLIHDAGMLAGTGPGVMNTWFTESFLPLLQR